ncbi:hypothetical protein FACS1894170_10740 [Planctomycetales bacterium]|nr:hypothetical protein FACS1894170_10740 [Planctomycetales bacterium]
MRLSLRTLLAFEDNVFDVEQHRQLEQVIPQHPSAVETLTRIRNAVRNPALGVPGLIDGQEELDPNFVAEYLDHHMSADLQERFENYCLSGDKYLGEIASIHQILSNVLGEPARTSRDCRLRCYTAREQRCDVPVAENKVQKSDVHIFRPDDESFATAPTSNEPEKAAQVPPLNTKKNVPFFAPLLNFIIPEIQKWPKNRKVASLLLLGLLGFGILHLQKPAKQSNVAAHNTVDVQTETPLPFEHADVSEHIPVAASQIDKPIAEDFAATNQYEAPEPQIAAAPPIAETDVTDPFLLQPTEQSGHQEFPTAAEQQPSLQTVASEQLQEPKVAFEPISKPADKVDTRSPRRDRLNQTAWQNPPQPVKITADTVEAVKIPAPVTARTPNTGNSSRPMQEVPAAVPPILQVSGASAAATDPVLGKIVPTIDQQIVFSAATSGSQWILAPPSSVLCAEEYLLTAVPFRGTLELTSSYQIEMIGDAKICILPPDQNGVSGIYVDYGRIVIRPLKANTPLRIETEKTQKTVSVSGTRSILFIDTFAEIVSPDDEQNVRPKTTPILGFIPYNYETLDYKSTKSTNRFTVSKQGSLLLHSSEYVFAEIQHLPNWLQSGQQTPDDRRLAEDVRKAFADVQGNSEAALNRFIQDKQLPLKAFGYRLWGDLGRFDVPLRMAAAKRQEDTAIRQALAPYFNEVMKRDAETIQRFADAIESVKKGQ